MRKRHVQSEAVGASVLVSVLIIGCGAILFWIYGFSNDTYNRDSYDYDESNYSDFDADVDSYEESDYDDSYVDDSYDSESGYDDSYVDDEITEEDLPEDVEEFLDYKVNHAPEGQGWNDN